MIGGIFETIGKTLGIGKEKYFLELDEAASKGVETLKTSAAKTAKAAKETVQEVSADATEKVQATVEAAAESAKSVVSETEKATPDKKASAKTTKTSQKTGKKDAKAAASSNAAPPSPAPQTQAKAPARLEPEEIIARAIAAGGKKLDSSGNVVEEAQNFSTDFLMPLGNRGRRRPGPSLGSYKGMAKEVNPRLKG